MRWFSTLIHIYTNWLTPARTTTLNSFNWLSRFLLRQSGGTFYWCQLLPPHFHDIHRDYKWFARLHCSLTSSRFKFLAPNGPFFGVSSSWGILKSRLFFGTNTSCENPEGLIMESIAAPKSYLDDRLEVVTHECSSPVSQVSKEHTAGYSAIRGEGPRV